jgi:peptide/nickel transport system permease protein
MTRAALTLLLLLFYALCWVAAPSGSLATLPANAPFLPPSTAHPLGTDDLGRDVLAALLQGGRTSLLTAGAATALAMGLGVAAGLFAGMTDGLPDEAVMRVADLVASLPVLLLAILAASLFGGSVLGLALLIGLTRWPVIARLTRVEARRLRAESFYRAAVALGGGPWHLARRHLLPNATAPALAGAGVVFGGAVLSEAALAFVGLGDPDVASWGGAIAAGFAFADRAPAIWAAPAAALALVSAGVALLADPAYIQRRTRAR